MRRQGLFARMPLTSHAFVAHRLLMKKPTEKRVKYERIRREQRARRVRAVKAKLEDLAKLGLVGAPYEVRMEYGRMLDKVTMIKAPAHIGLGHGAPTLKFFARIRDAADDSSARVVIDLRRCQEIYPDACLILHAELYRLRARKGIDGVRGLLPDDPEACKRLKTVGLLPAFEGAAKQLQKVQYNPNAAPAQFIVVETGIALDGGESLGIAKSFARGLNLDDAAYSPIHAALNDALENISEHAYHGASPSEERRWWACTIGAPDEPLSYLLAYDLGVTIPATVPQTAQKGGAPALEALKRFLKGKPVSGASEPDLLLAAFDPAITRRESGKGGRGLPNMRQLADQYPGGELTVWSGKAAAWTDGGELKASASSGELKGTFILWCIRTDAKGAVGSDNDND